MKTPAAVTRLVYASWQHLIEAGFCLPRPYFSPPHTYPTKSVFLKALQSVSRQNAWRAVTGTKVEPWPGGQAFRVGFPHKPRQKVTSWRGFQSARQPDGIASCERPTWSFRHSWTVSKRVSTSPVTWGFFARPFMIISLSRRLTTALKKERKTNKNAI